VGQHQRAMIIYTGRQGLDYRVNEVLIPSCGAEGSINMSHSWILLHVTPGKSFLQQIYFLYLKVVDCSSEPIH
jgi:hypothetical protein